MVLGRRFKPFPLPMSLGNDICRISRIGSILSREPKDAARFVRRILTKDEIGSVRNPLVRRWIEDFYPVSNEKAKDKQSIRTPRAEMTSLELMRALRGASEFLAGRWAAKEAIIKALPHRRVTFHDIRIYSTPEALARHGKEEKETTKMEDEGEGEVEAEGKGEGKEIITNKDDKNQNTNKKTEEENDTRRAGRPVAIVRGRKEIGEEDVEVLISISHDGDYASAVCLGWTGSSKQGAGRAKKSEKGTRWKTLPGVWSKARSDHPPNISPMEHSSELRPPNHPTIGNDEGEEGKRVKGEARK